ncbi:site-specific integrase [Paracoccus hibiscisoli]|uniref:Integrase n=1 Tax=Paracoccus hibiscisoli TaxID=2023261 RepID=A0A4U0QXI6_9RHOB|nr:tyrosine-type recombinase/integrase [Paracoccus hibiscisoli]TJZ86985.1 integrase [Paracoccus hibiscisoli]
MKSQCESLSIKVLQQRQDLAKLPPRQANARLKTWRLICKSAKARAVIRADPSTGLSKVHIETSGYTSWSAEDISAFRARWPIGTVQRACFELVFWTGTRTVDAVQVGRQHLGRDGLLVFRQSKTGGTAHVPWTSPLPAYASTWKPERDLMHLALECLSGGMTFLQSAQGASRSVKGLGNVINEGARDAGLTDRTAHGLRKARLTMIAEYGGSAHAIMAWGGHKTLAEAQRYTRSADLKRLVLGTEQDQNEVNPAVIPVNFP